MKDHIRDYATEAFRFYASNGKDAGKYKQKIYDEALFNYTKETIGAAGISCPTESAIIAAENEVTQKLAEIKDMEAVEMALAEFEATARIRDIGRAVEIVYFTDSDKELKTGDIQNRVHMAELDIPASESSVYRYLRKAREAFAENRGLRLNYKKVFES